MRTQSIHVLNPQQDPRASESFTPFPLDSVTELSQAGTSNDMRGLQSHRSISGDLPSVSSIASSLSDMSNQEGRPLNPAIFPKTADMPTATKGSVDFSQLLIDMPLQAWTNESLEKGETQERVSTPTTEPTVERSEIVHQPPEQQHMHRSNSSHGIEYLAREARYRSLNLCGDFANKYLGIAQEFKDEWGWEGDCIDCTPCVTLVGASVVCAVAIPLTVLGSALFGAIECSTIAAKKLNEACSD